MTDNEIKLKKIKMSLNLLAEYYFQNLTENQVVMYARDLMVLSLEEVEKAVKIYRTDVSNEKFPLPSKLLEIARPSKENPREVGVEVASRIIKAIRKKGYTWSWEDSYRPYENFKDAFIAEVGELAWEVVNLNGGWQSLCESDIDEGVLTAQLRDRAAALYSKGLRGNIHTLPQVPRSRMESTETSKLGDTIRNLLPAKTLE